MGKFTKIVLASFEKLWFLKFGLIKDKVLHTNIN
jgi:hypothetical protein